MEGNKFYFVQVKVLYDVYMYMYDILLPGSKVVITYESAQSLPESVVTAALQQQIQFKLVNKTWRCGTILQVRRCRAILQVWRCSTILQVWRCRSIPQV